MLENEEKNNLEQNETAPEPKKEMPPVKHSSMIIIALFAVIFAAGWYFFPYLQNLIGFGGQTLHGTIYGVQEMSIEQLVHQEKLTTVVIGKVVKKSEPIRDTSVLPDDGIGALVYREVLIEVTEVLYGDPVYTSGKTIITYELGGSYLSTQGGKPQKFNVVYENAAELKENQEMLLFLDNTNNIMHERYGLFYKQSDGFFYDYKNHVYSVDSVKKLIATRTEE